MKEDPRIVELMAALRSLARVQVRDQLDEVSVVVEKPVDIHAVDKVLLEAELAEPLDRLERPDSWLLRFMKRERKKPSHVAYDVVRVMDSYYEYRPRIV